MSDERMPLSQAIRLGSMLRPQGFNWTFPEDKSCALGAAIDAHGKRSEWFAAPEIVNASKLIMEEIGCGWAWETRCKCPCCFCGDALAEIIAHLNDCHKWTREQIATWVEQQEAALEAAQRTAAAIVEQGSLTL